MTGVVVLGCVDVICWSWLCGCSGTSGEGEAMFGDVGLVVLVVWLVTRTALDLGNEIRIFLRKRG